MNSHEPIARVIEPGFRRDVRDRERVAAAFHAHRAALIIYATELLDGAGDAEDVVQDVFLALIEGDCTLPPVGVDRALRSLVHTISSWWIANQTAR